MIFFGEILITATMTAIATPVFKMNYLFELPNDLKQIIKKKEIQLNQENQKIAEKFQQLTNPDTKECDDYNYIIDEFKYMNNEEFEDIHYHFQLLGMVGAVSFGRRTVKEVYVEFNSNQIDGEDLVNEIRDIHKTTARIKKSVDDYGIFKILKIYEKRYGEQMDLSKFNEQEFYDHCYYELICNEFNSKITFDDIVKMRKYDLKTEYH